jgi:excisionase family DNA binding protein
MSMTDAQRLVSELRTLMRELLEAHTSLLQVRQELERHRRFPEQRWLTVEACAQYISRTPAAVRSLLARGAIPHHKPDGRILVDRDVVDAWVRGEGLSVPHGTRRRR